MTDYQRLWYIAVGLEMESEGVVCHLSCRDSSLTHGFRKKFNTKTERCRRRIVCTFGKGGSFLHAGHKSATDILLLPVARRDGTGVRGGRRLVIYSSN